MEAVREPCPQSLVARLGQVRESTKISSRDNRPVPVAPSHIIQVYDERRAISACSADVPLKFKRTISATTSDQRFDGYGIRSPIPEEAYPEAGRSDRARLAFEFRMTSKNSNAHPAAIATTRLPIS